jgi:hypothetical protein
MALSALDFPCKKLVVYPAKSTYYPEEPPEKQSGSAFLPT